MQKVYLLLRNNTKTGPYSLEEILQLHLKPFDLVWVEGRSAAWQYPFEVAALKPYVAETPQAIHPFQPIATEVLDKKIVQQNAVLPKTEAPKKIFVSIPKNYQPVAEQASSKIEEVKPLAASYSQQAYASPNFYTEQMPVEEKTSQIKASGSLHHSEGHDSKWMYHNKPKKKSSVHPKDLVLAALIIAVIGGGYYVMSKPSVTNSVLPFNKTPEQKTEQATQTIVDKSSAIKNDEEINTTYESVQQNTVLSTPNYAKSSTIKKAKNPVIASLKKPASVPQSKNSIPVEKTTPNIPTGNTDKEVEVKQQAKSERQPGEKKKKFADVIKNIFAKKEKKQEAKTNGMALENPRPAENRQATKRENNDAPLKNNSSEETTAANIMDQIELSSNAPDSWMMGVKNLKITLHNRSNATIQTASATVTYYDQNNQLLDKKIIYFSNIAPKGKASVAAPDSKWADHADFKLTTASAKQDQYAAY